MVSTLYNVSAAFAEIEMTISQYQRFVDALLSLRGDSLATREKYQCRRVNGAPIESIQVSNLVCSLAR